MQSNSSATYEELTVHDSSHHFNSHPQHQYQRDPNYSPRHHGEQVQSPRGHGSPHTKSKFFHEPQSPQQAGNQPFSYMSQTGQMSPKMLRRQNSSGQAHESNGQNGQQAMHYQQFIRQSGSNNVNGQNSQIQYRNTSVPEEMHSASPATSYGKQDSVFHPQPHRPPPAGPPPPPPPGGQSMPNPNLPRHSVATVDMAHRAPRSPVITPKLSQRSRSVPNPGQEGLLLDPPPPLSIKDGYIAATMQATGPPSPPLPPPPPEMLNNSPQASFRLAPSHSVDNSHLNMQMMQQQNPPVAPSSYPGAGLQYQTQPQQSYMGGVNQQVPTPPPPPIATIPSKRPPPQFESPSRASNPVAPPVQRGVNPPGPQMGSPQRASKEPAASSTDLMNELNRVQLKKTGTFFLKLLY